MKIITWVRDAYGVHVAFIRNGNKVETQSFPVGFSDDEVKSALAGNKKPVEAPVVVVPPEKEPEKKAAYQNPPEDIKPNNEAKKEEAKNRPGMLRDLNRAGIKGFQTAKLDAVRAAWEKARREGKL